MPKLTKIGIQVGGILQLYPKVMAQLPISVKFYGNALNHDNVWNCRADTVVLRNIGRGLDYGWDGDIVAKANAVADAHIAVLAPYLASPHAARKKLWVECHNEPPTYDNALTFQQNIDRAKRGNEWQVIVADRLHRAGFEHVLAYSFSVGTPKEPPYDALNMWQYYGDGAAACEGVALHEYMNPASAGQYGLMLRYRDAYAAMPVKRPIMLTELGYGFVAGYLGSSIDWPTYAAILDFYDNEFKKDSFLLCAHLFVAGADSGQWGTWDICNDPEYETKVIPWIGTGVVPDATTLPPDPTPVPNPPPTGEPMTEEQERLKAAWNSIGKNVNATGIPYHPEFAFPTKAASVDFGPPLGQEYSYTNTFSGPRQGQAFLNGIVETAANVYDQNKIGVYRWKDGKPWTPPVVVPPPVQQNARMTFVPKVTLDTGEQIDVGFQIELCSPQIGQRYWAITAVNGFKFGVGTEVIVTCLRDGRPVGSLPVTQAFDPQRLKSITVLTDGLGARHVLMGPGDDYTPPATPPDRLYVSKPLAAGESYDALQGVRWPTPDMADVLLCGQVGGHTQYNVTMEQLIFQG